MGMFDYVKCEYPLPGLEDPTKLNFQTKDLECLMDVYTITKEGRMLRKRWDSDEESKLIGEDTNYHGYLQFYDYVRISETKDIWYEYKAKFTDGALISVEKTTPAWTLPKDENE